jgi:transketolase
MMEDLESKAKELRKKVLDLAIETGESHLGGSFSEIELLIALYNQILKKEDKFILSKGHAYHPLYLILKEKGYNPKLSVHPDIDEKNGVYCTTGSLGHGFPIGTGMCLARKIENKPGKVYILMGDGECQEGTTWESALIASKNKLDNLCLIIDRNKLQALDEVDKILPLGNLSNKFKEFGFNVSEINGHSFDEILGALNYKSISKPYAIVANTIKGKGISYMENDPKWHTRLPNQEELKIAYKELK